ncbi:MAG: hypothetical protein KC493_06255 [Bacteriovoracaceae bacterium]|nr:hypothetical protein [Bacteriovoracaceae bacterium]
MKKKLLIFLLLIFVGACEEKDKKVVQDVTKDPTRYLNDVVSPVKPGCEGREDEIEIVSNTEVSNICALCKTSKPDGHRGGGDYCSYPENTLLAMRALIECGQNRHPKKLSYIEFDINSTKDGKLVVFHGPKLKKYFKYSDHPELFKEFETKTGKKFKHIRISDLDYEDIKRIKMPMDQQIPTLNQYLSAADTYGLSAPIVPDLKFIEAQHIPKLLSELKNYKDRHVQQSTYKGIDLYSTSHRWGNLSRKAKVQVCSYGSSEDMLSKKLKKKCRKFL